MLGMVGMQLWVYQPRDSLMNKTPYKNPGTRSVSIL